MRLRRDYNKVNWCYEAHGSLRVDCESYSTNKHTEKVITMKKVIPSLLISTSLFFAASGCATIRHPVPPDLIMKARISNVDGIRIMQGETKTALQENLLMSVKEEDPKDFPTGRDGTKEYVLLAISGGGANGAYGAGLLKGWSEAGTRPLFKVITGVSTGAIIAPFVFLGKDYDDELEMCYTNMSTKDVIGLKPPLMALFGDSLVSNAPLARTIAKMVNKDILDKIAVQHRRGRRLFVGTANLDTQRFVIWDMGVIACRGDVELFRKVIVASAAIPMIFPPSVFHVEVDGKIYDEIHVDGGTLTQVFTTYNLLEGMAHAAKGLGINPAKIKGKIYVIRNGYMTPVYKRVDDNLISLAQRSFDAIIDSQGIGDAYRIYTFARQRGTDYNLAFIPSDFVQNNKEMFDPKAMRRLFDRGYQDAAGGYKWHKSPPGIDATASDGKII